MGATLIPFSFFSIFNFLFLSYTAQHRDGRGGVRVVCRSSGGVGEGEQDESGVPKLRVLHWRMKEKKQPQLQHQQKKKQKKNKLNHKSSIFISR